MYRLHKPSGQAVVTVEGKDFYLGKHQSEESRAEYDRIIGEWLANGRRLKDSGSKKETTILELVHAYWNHAKVYYGGGHRGEVGSIKLALVHLKRLYGHTKANQFGPLALKTVRGQMVNAGWSRNYINSQIGRIRRAFKWATEEELVKPDIYHGLMAVSGLKKGKSDAVELAPIQSASESMVRAIFPYVAPQIRAMIELQLLTGMRPGEVCQMRSCDIDTSVQPWVYTPGSHKTEHLGHHRSVYLGPKAQEALRPWLRPDLQAYLFQPKEVESQRRERAHANRKTPLSCGNVPGSNVQKKPKRAPGEHYATCSYGRAIAYACERAFPLPEPIRRAKGESLDAWMGRLTDPEKQQVQQWRDEHHWHPHQLRHNAATRLRKEYGLEAAQVILGHKTLSVTELYAEKNVAAAQRIMGEVG